MTLGIDAPTRIFAGIAMAAGIALFGHGATAQTARGTATYTLERPVAVFEGRAQTPATNLPALDGTAWRLLRFQGGDDRTLTPDDPAKYTIEFGSRGRLTARIDCNRGRGTWKSRDSSQLELGPLALTRARCPEGSLHDHIVKHWPYIRSYVVKNGHLFLAVMADGGTYEFEPLVRPAPQEIRGRSGR